MLLLVTSHSDDKVSLKSISVLKNLSVLSAHFLLVPSKMHIYKDEMYVKRFVDEDEKLGATVEELQTRSSRFLHSCIGRASTWRLRPCLSQSDK